MPVISYVTTVYNKAEYLPAVVQSQFDQEGDFDREYIFVDDGSDDDSLAILKQLIANREDCVLLSGENQGPSRATNKGIALARGEYIKLVDGDDILLDDMTRKLLDALQQDQFGVALGVKSSYRLASGAPIFNEPEKQTAAKLHRPLHKLFKNAFFTPTHMMFKRDLLKNEDACDERVYIQDYSIALKLAHITDFIIVPDAVFYAPEDAANRMSHNVAQTLHDLNAAMFYFLSGQPDIDPELSVYAARRATGRAWRWALRETRSWNVRAAATRSYFRARTPFANSRKLDLIRRSCHVFQNGFAIKDPLR